MIEVILVGAGNVSWHLARTFDAAGIRVIQVVNRNLVRAREVASLLNTEATSDISEMRVADFVILAVNDDALPEVISAIPPQSGILVHTSGSTDISVLEHAADHFGVLYPFQTLTRGVDVPAEKIPFLIEGSDDKTLKRIRLLAEKMSPHVVTMDSVQRRKLHLAGAIANNFTNYLIGRAQDYLTANEIDPDLLLPLIRETVRKLEFIPPSQGQTGPARRGNTRIIREHLKLLESTPDLKNLYSMISDSILAYYSNSSQ